MSEQWIRSERPDGHRSLWFKVALWIRITVADVSPPRLWIGPADEDIRAYCPDGMIGERTAPLGCPVPTPADLAWLRGDG